MTPGRPDPEPGLLERLLHRGILQALPGLDLPARKLPIAGIRFSVGALRKEERAVGPLDHRRRHFRYFCRRAYFFFRPT